MSNAKSQSKQKLSDVAKDLGISNQELIDFVENKFGEVKKATASLTADQLNIILENYTQNNQVESFDGYFAKRNEPKPVKKEEPKAEFVHQMFCLLHKYSNICIAFVAAPFLKLSATTQRFNAFGQDSSLRTLPTNTSSFPCAVIGMG